MPNELGARIRAARKKKKMTQDDLARLVNTTKQNIYKYETGITTNIPLDRLEAIALALDVDPAELTGWIEQEEKPQAPQTIEARIVSFAMDQMTQEERDRVLSVLQAVFNNNPDLFKKGTSNDDA